jgi:mannose-1-phosphate guanylyltransferase
VPEKIEAARSVRSPTGVAHALILAGGDGLRLRPLTRLLTRDDRPKQFCPVMGDESLLAQTRRRAALLFPPEQTQIVLTRAHEPYYRDLVAGLPRSSPVLQPEGRGTAVAVLYALLRVARRTPESPVVILPSDHWVSDDVAFMAHVAAAVGAVEAHRELIVLLGIKPTRPEPEYGWIEPSEPVFGRWRDLLRVRRFVEKPAPEVARALQKDGSLWNSFVVAGQVAALLALFDKALPSLLDSFLAVSASFDTPSEGTAIERLYRELPAADFSRDVLAAQPAMLAVLPVQDLLWDDLGNPSRALAARRRASLAGLPEWTTSQDRS